MQEEYNYMLTKEIEALKSILSLQYKDDQRHWNFKLELKSSFQIYLEL